MQINILQASATVSISNLTQTYDGTPKIPTVTTTPAGLNVTVTYNGSSTPPVNAGSYQVVAAVNDSNYLPSSRIGILTINRATPTITWSNPADITYGTGLDNAQLNATASVPGTFTYAPGLGTVLNAGSNQILSVNFTPTDTSNYNSASKSVSINILKANQTINFDLIPSKTFGDAPFSLSATTLSGLPIIFQILSGPATISGNTVTINGTGTVTVRASQSGSPNYNVATPVDRSFDVVAANANIALSNLAQTYDGTAKFATATTNPAGKSVTITYSQNGAPVTSPINAGAYNVTATINDPNFQGTTTGTLVINKATPVITWNNPANVPSGTALSSTQLNATANVLGSFLYNVPAGIVLSAGTYQLTVIFIPTDVANYNSVAASVSLTVFQLPVVQLSAASYSVGKGDGHVSVIVTRTGDTSASTNVNYATSDRAGLTPCGQPNTGIASSRCNYATTVGTLQFATNETTKTIFIPVVDSAYAEGNKSFALTLSNPVGATLGTPSTATITIINNNTVTGGNPIVGVPFFVRQQYIDFLGREPDAGGLAGWQSILNNCPQSGKDAQGNFCDRIEVSAGFFRSPEFQDRGYFVFRFYPVALGRNPNYNEFMPDLAKVSGFLSDAQLEANKVAFIQEFMSRPEFQTKYGSLTDAAFRSTLVQTAGIDPGIAFPNGTMTRAQFLRAFVESAVVSQKFYNQSFVVMQYFGYLRRDPDILYLQWIDTMNKNGGDYRAMINGFMNSSEYFLRFGP